MTESVSRALAIAHTTLREILRGKVLVATFGFALILVAIVSLFGAVTIGDQAKVIKDFGLFTVSLFPVGFAVVSGSSLLHQELSRKTIYNVLSKPVRRSEFVAGKFLGMVGTSTVLLFMLAATLSIYLKFFEGTFDRLLFQAYALCWFEVVLMCGVALFFSSLVVTPALSGLFSFGVFLAGRSTEILLYFISEGSIRGPAEWILKSLYWGLPHLSSLYVSNGIVHGTGVTASFILVSGAYALSYAALLLFFAQALFSRRDFN